MTGASSHGDHHAGRPPEPPDGGSRFAADWLALREPIDHRTRAEELLGPLVATWRERGWRRVVDLGAATGSSGRYLAPRLPRPQSWLLVDHDRALLDRAQLPGEAGEVMTLAGDLDREGLDAVAGADLVTGAALLDLVSATWLTAFVDACVTASAGGLFTTIYDGTVSWETDAGAARPEDALVRGLVNAHQLRDKGLGGSLGPEAAPTARRLFEAAGFRTWLVPSPWVLGQAEAGLAALLIDGWVDAACEQSPADESRIRAWGLQRTADLRAGDARVLVGHLDLLALPPSEDPR